MNRARKTLQCLVSAFALVLVVTSCARGPASHAGIPDPVWNTAVADPLEPIGLLRDQANPSRVHRVPTYRSGDVVGAWRLLEIRNGGRQLVLQYSQGGECDTDKGVVLAETTTEVAIAPVYRHPAMPIPCVAMLLTPSGIVTLDKPLGNRKLLHIPGDNAFPMP